MSFNPIDGFLFDLYFHPYADLEDYHKLREDIEKKTGRSSKNNGLETDNG